jgi:hypothetical protein
MTANRGTPAPWDAVVIPQCPCPWRLTCSTPTQEGVAQLWRSGRFTKPADCFYYAHRVQVHRDATGHDAPGSVAELQQQLGARRASEQEAGPGAPLGGA